jgi:hypothetical protein
VPGGFPAQLSADTDTAGEMAASKTKAANARICTGMACTDTLKRWRFETRPLAVMRHAAHAGVGARRTAAASGTFYFTETRRATAARSRLFPP